MNIHLLKRPLSKFLGVIFWVFLSTSITSASELDGFLLKKNQKIIALDRISFKGLTDQQCAQVCNAVDSFACKSFEYYRATKKCVLSDRVAGDRGVRITNDATVNLYLRKSNRLPRAINKVSGVSKQSNDQQVATTSRIINQKPTRQPMLVQDLPVATKGVQIPTISSPATGEKWFHNNAYRVKWDPKSIQKENSNLPANTARILLTPDSQKNSNGIPGYVLSLSIPNNGSHTVGPIPVSAPPGKYVIRISPNNSLTEWVNSDAFNVYSAEPCTLVDDAVSCINFYLKGRNQSSNMSIIAPWSATGYSSLYAWAIRTTDIEGPNQVSMSYHRSGQRPYANVRLHTEGRTEQYSCGLGGTCTRVVPGIVSGTIYLKGTTSQ